MLDVIFGQCLKGVPLYIERGGEGKCGIEKAGVKETDVFRTVNISVHPQVMSFTA